jgi:hypothetical protein
VKRPSEWIALVTVLALFMFLNAHVARQQTSDEHFPPFTTFSGSPTGMRGLLTLAQRMGIRAGRWQRPYARLDDAIGLLWTVPPTLPPTDPALRRWIESGGTLVYQGPPRTAPFVPAEVDVREPGGALSRRLPAIDPNILENRGAPASVTGDAAAVRDVRRLWISPARRTSLGRPLVRDAAGGIIVSHDLGAGRVLVVVDNTLFLNRTLAREDNAVLAANLLHAYAGGRRVEFDEVVHGYAAAERSRWDDLLSNVRGWAYAQIAFAAALLLISAGWRMGPPVPLPEPERLRYAVEYVRSMASLYRRAGARARSAALMDERWRREVLPRLGLTAAADTASIASRLAPDAAEAYRAAAGRLASGVRTDADLIRIGRELELARRRVLAKDA